MSLDKSLRKYHSRMLELVKGAAAVLLLADGQEVGPEPISSAAILYSLRCTVIFRPKVYADPVGLRLIYASGKTEEVRVAMQNPSVPRSHIVVTFMLDGLSDEWSRFIN